MASNSSELMLDRAEGFVRRERSVQRVGVGLMGLFMLAGAVGLFGQGALSHREQTSGHLTVRYERFSRLMLRNSVAISARATSADAAAVRISIDKSFLDAVSIEEMRPPHVEMEIQQDHIVFRVPVVSGAATLELSTKPLRGGFHRTSIRLEGDASATVVVAQLVFF